jgi:hypothetical protein
MDELKIYMGDDYVVNEFITVKQPTIGEIIEYGEREYFSMIHRLCAIPSDMKSQLWDSGFDWQEVTDFQLFISLVQDLHQPETEIILGDLDLGSLEQGFNKETNQVVLYDPDTGLIIDEYIYLKIVTFLRMVHGIKPKVEKAKTKTVRDILIQLDRENIARARKEGYKSQLKTLISAMMRYPGFKYKKNELRECGLYEFMDTVQGAQIFVSTNALLHGMYSGFVDTKKINKKDFNWLREVTET